MPKDCFQSDTVLSIPIKGKGSNSICSNYASPIQKDGEDYYISVIKKGWKGQIHCIPLKLDYPTNWVEYWDHGICGEHLWLVQWGEVRQSGGYNDGGNCANSSFHSIYDSNFVVDHECVVSETWESFGETHYSYDFFQLIALEFSQESGHAIYPDDLPMPNRIRVTGELSIGGSNPYGQTSKSEIYLDGKYPGGSQIIQKVLIPLGDFDIDLIDPLSGTIFQAFSINTVIYGGTSINLKIDLIEMWW